MTTTHIILDDVHERDKCTDFLLIVIKDALISYPDLKIILMSATIDSSIFVNYFDGRCPHVHIPGRIFNVNVYHLEETLAMVGYTNPNIQTCAEKIAANLAATASNGKLYANGVPINLLNRYIPLQTILFNSAIFSKFIYLMSQERFKI